MATIGIKNVRFCKGLEARAHHEIAIWAGLSLTFRARRRLRRATFGKTFFSTRRPVARGRRPTPDSAVRPRAQTCLEYRHRDIDDDLLPRPAVRGERGLG